MNAGQLPNIPSASLPPTQGAPVEEQKAEVVKVPVDSFTYGDGVNHPIEAALLPSVDQVLGQGIAPFLMQGGAKVKGTITRADKPDFKELVNLEITSNTFIDEKTQQMSGETTIRGAYGTAQNPSHVLERGTLVGFQEGETVLPGMTIQGYVNRGQTEVNEELINVIGPGGAVTQGHVTKDIEVVQQSAAFLPEVEPDKIPENIDPTTLGSYQVGKIGGVTFERVVIPDSFPNYKIIGQFGDLKEEGTIQFSEDKAVIDRTIGPFRIREEVTRLQE